MPRNTPGKKQLSTQVDAETLDRFKEYVKGRQGDSLSAGTERAMRREMANPPPVLELPPLPPLVVTPRPAFTPKPKKVRKQKPDKS